MALSNVNFIRSANGLGRPLEGFDHVSGLLFYSNTLPSGFASNDRIKVIYSLPDAENLGITNTQIGATAATGTITVTNKGAVGDTAVIKVTGTLGEVTIASYTQVLADITSTTTAADRIVAEINAGTATHGYSASNVSAVVTVTAPLKEGVFLNTVSAVFTPTGTLAATVVAFSSGVGSIIDVLHYHISEYFRIQPKGKLYVGIYAEESTTYTFAAAKTMQIYADGEIRQMAVYEKNVAFATSQLTVLQAICADLESLYMPMQIVLNAEISATANVSSLTTLTSLSNYNVSALIAQDGANAGSILFKALGKSVGVCGAALGSISLAAVNESIAWVQKFNMATTELDTIAFSNGQLYKDVANSLLETLDSYHYIFLRKLTGITGSFFNFAHTAVSGSSDYSTIELNRVWHKVTRNLRTVFLPNLNAPVKVSADGTLTDSLIAYYETLCNRQLELMEAANELSTHKVIINPLQDVLATSELEITVQNVPLGVSKIFKVNVGYVKSV